MRKQTSELIRFGASNIVVHEVGVEGVSDGVNVKADSDRRTCQRSEYGGEVVELFSVDHNVIAGPAEMRQCLDGVAIVA